MNAPLRFGGWQSLSGVRLDAISLTRFIYLDESGTSRHEPDLIVAAVIVHADSQLGPIEDAFQDLRDAYLPEGSRDGFIFHAADLFNGNKALPAELRDESARHELLEKIVSIPVKLELPVGVGLVHKEAFRRYARIGSATQHQVLVAMHAAAIAEFTVGCERWMRSHAKQEVALLIAENNDEVREAARETQTLLRSRNWPRWLQVQGHDVLPLVKIKDAINFVRKEESQALQLADACAWTFRKRHHQRASRFYKILKKQVHFISMTSSDAAGRLSQRKM